MSIRISSVFVKMTVVSMFVVTAAAAGCGGGAKGTCVAGPDGWCWSIYSQQSTTAAWVTPPSATSAHAYLTSTTQPYNAGVYFFSPGDIDLSRFDRIIFTATASSGFAFDVGGGNSNVGCTTNFSGNGTTTTYTYEFSECSRWSTDASEPPFSFARANQFTWQTVWETASSLDIEIVPDILFCLGTHCTANPLSPNNLIGLDGGVSGSGGASGATGTNSSCPAGTETCPCYGNDTCNTGLTCASHLCVNLGAGLSGGGDAGVSDAPGAQPDVPIGGSGGGASGTTRADAAPDVGDCQMGPGGFCWATWTPASWTNPGPKAAWVEPPSPASVHLSATSGSDTVAGMTAAIRDGNAAVDLGQYDQVWFDANVPTGTEFTVSISGDATATAAAPYCVWNLVAGGNVRYTVDLRSAETCWPTACGFDRSRASYVGFQTAGWGAANTLDMSLTAIGFTAVTSGFTSVTIGGNASLGLNGWCTSLYSYGQASAAWIGAPGAIQVQTQVTNTSTAGSAGALFELPVNQRNLSGTTSIQVAAAVQLNGSDYFKVQLNDMNGADCQYYLVPYTSAYSYVIPIVESNMCQTSCGYAFDRGNVHDITIGSAWNLAGIGDFTITQLDFE